MSAKRRRKLLDEVYPPAFHIIEEEEQEKIYKALLSKKIFACAFEAAFSFTSQVALEQALTFEEALTLAYKDAVKEALQAYY
jgi:hypothetical protein